MSKILKTLKPKRPSPTVQCNLNPELAKFIKSQQGETKSAQLRHIIEKHIPDLPNHETAEAKLLYNHPEVIKKSHKNTENYTTNIKLEIYNKIKEIAKQNKITTKSVCQAIVFNAKNLSYSKVKNNNNIKEKTMIYSLPTDNLLVESKVETKNALKLLEHLVKKLLEDGEKIHELQWFKEILKKNKPHQDDAQYKHITDIINGSCLDGIQPRIHEIQEALLSAGFTMISVPITHNILYEVLEDMICAKIINKHTSSNSYSLYIPEPLTNEENIMTALEDQANGDWVNIPWLNRTLHLDNEQDQSIVLGRLLNLEIQNKVKRSEISGQPHWTIANE